MSAALLALVALLAQAPIAGHPHASCACEAHRPPVASAKLTVFNATGRSVELLVDDLPRATLPPGATTLRLPAGPARLSARVEGREIDQALLRLLPHEDRLWELHAPTLGALRVVNPLPVPVTALTPDGRSHTIDAWGEARLAGLPVGLQRVTLLRPDGRVLEVREVEVDPWSLRSLHARAPSTGLVVVDNDHGRPLRVFVDGRPMAELPCGGEIVLDLIPGRHRIDLVEDNGRTARTLRSVGVEVDLWQITRLDVWGGPQRPVAARAPHPVRP